MLNDFEFEGDKVMTKRNISRLAFGIILVGFLLPFATVSFIIKLNFSGFQLIMGDKNYYIPSIASAVIAFLAAICGFGASFIENKKYAIPTVIVSVIGIIALFSLGGKLSGGLAGSLVSLQFGYYMNILLFAVAGGVSVLSIKDDSAGKLEDIFSQKINCTKCGAVMSSKAEFCDKCGNKAWSNPAPKLVPDINPTPKSVGTDPINNTGVTSKKPVLRGLAGQHSGKSYNFDGNKLILGRDPIICNVVFMKDTPGISRVHCEISFDEKNSNFIIQDNGSSYGTFLASGVKLTNGQPYVLSSGESFYLATRTNMFEVSM